MDKPFWIKLLTAKRSEPGETGWSCRRLDRLRYGDRGRGDWPRARGPIDLITGLPWLERMGGVLRVGLIAAFLTAVTVFSAAPAGAAIDGNCEGSGVFSPGPTVDARTADRVEIPRAATVQ